MKKFVPAPIEDYLVENFQMQGVSMEISGFKFVSGGCINSAGVLETTIGKMFIKWNDSTRFPGMFEVEFKGLELLRRPDVIHIPEPLISAEAGSFSFLVTEFIESAPYSSGYWDQLGQSLAALHRVSKDVFGLDHNNYIGSLHQTNTYKSNWITFYIENRLEPQLKLAVDQGKLGSGHIRKFQQLNSFLATALPAEESPSLLHGDLWGGNIMSGPKGEPVIFDPAVYFGSREVDLAMTRLFGGFDRRFYEAYKEAFPFVSGYQERVEIYQLYPLLVHVNLFGGGYIGQVEHILNRYV